MCRLCIQGLHFIIMPLTSIEEERHTEFNYWKKNTCWIFGGNKDVWEKKTGCRWTNNWHLSGICCTFHRFFFVLLVPLKEAGYQAVCSLPEVVDRGLGLNWRSTEKGNFLASVMEWPKVCILWGEDSLNWTGSQALLRLPGSRTEAFRLHRIHFCLPEVP